MTGRKDWFDIHAVFDEIVEPGSRDRDVAMAIWQFLVANRHHGFPTRNRAEMHDPVRFLNVYGYGFCDDAADIFKMLAEIAGFKARIWYLQRNLDLWPRSDLEGTRLEPL